MNARPRTWQPGRDRPSARPKRLETLALGWLALACLTLIGCGGGAYGFSRTYSPLDAESAALSGGEDYDPVMARRLPQEWQQKKLHLFGVVVNRSAGRDGLADLTLSVRRLAARNLCETSAEDSCRVTVSDHEISRTHVLLTVAQGDDVGKDRLQPRSLVRVVGKLEDQPHERDGNDVLVASYYRHWPPGKYVTEKAREYMRR